MTARRPAAPDGDRPLTIAHRFGNDRGLLRAAVEVGVDLVEADVWCHRGRLEVRHLKTLGPIPLLWDHNPYRLVSGRATRLTLDEIMAELPPHQELMLDLKGEELLSPRRVLDVMHRTLPDIPYTVCSQSWRLLDAFRDEGHVRVVHSVGNRRMLRRVLSRLTWHDQHAISIDRRLLDADVVRRLRDVVPLVMTWRVNDPDALRTVVEWGVNGIISDDIALLADVAAGRLPGPYDG